MSLNPAVCRICLAVDVRLLTIEGSLQSVYEKISTNTLHTADGRPVTACYICYAQLNKCRKLMLTAARAENVLSDIFKKYSEITVESVSLADRSCIQGVCGLTVSVTKCFDALRPTTAAVEMKLEAEDVDTTEDMGAFPLPLQVIISGVEDEDSGSDAEDHSPLSSLRAETRVEDELRGDGASARISGAEKHKQAEGNVTDRNQQPSGIDTGEDCHECHVCQCRFNQKNDLNIHLMTHTGEKPCECKVCHKQFIRQSDLHRHLKTHTGEKPYECNVCQSRFGQKYKLECHFRKHTGEKPYKCSECPSRFSGMNYLKKHLRTHTGEKPYQCNICQNRFCEDSHLRKHLRTHTGEKPFECQVCKKRFSQNANLKSHLRIHTGEKPYECHVCQKRFIQQSELQRHLRRHTGEKPYECNTCQRRFNQQASLQRHLRTHTGEKPYICHVCENRYSDKKNLDSHLKKHT